MSWRLAWTRPASRDLRRLDRQTGERIRTALRQYAESEHGDLRRLRGPGEEWRLRVGDWRIRVSLDAVADTMTVLRVLPRGRAYRR